MKRKSILGNPARGEWNDPHWYKDAIVYELRIRSYYDSNGDGVGDIAGVTEKLDYLQDLGVTALWLLPFYPSPLRDDGYDISDYTDVHPEVGTLADFQTLLKEAHRRGLRIITELVLNHTSDEHPWFKRARRAPPGSSERNFYVWSDSPERYKDARIIFKDFEPSNWAFDRVARAYFWHRFYAHQPDLNFENPDVHKALFDVVDFWFGMGVDGVRLDAVPYLYEAEGTNCENLPQTHEFIRKLRKHVDSKFQSRMLLAEANQWPEDAAAYFGNDDECHMNFHFPIMPRMFMAIHQEDRFPIIDILEQTPQLPPSGQWALFLRNHDELTLEMVTDEERDYMYRAYAHETSMRINLGIRRRLAPLVGNDRRKMELLNGLLLSLPGTPVLYYGDEIGMGDNFFLGDRNGVRTPMQWSADRNAGFSRANPQRLILPIIIDPEYHYEAINVEAQQGNSNSLLWWTKRLVALRKRFKAFGRGTIEFLHPANPSVLAFVRQYQDEAILVVANLSRFVQFVELDLSKFKQVRPVELMGHTEFPAVGDLPYLLTLGGHAFYWFALERETPAEVDVRAQRYSPPTVECTSVESVTLGEERTLLEELLPAFLQTRRWFQGRDRDVAAVRVVEAAPLGGMAVLLISVEYRTGHPEMYQLPLAALPEWKVGMQSVLASLKLRGATLEGAPHALLIDALEDLGSARKLLTEIARQTRARGRSGEVVASHPVPELELPTTEPRIIGATHAHAAIQYGDRYLLKVYRLLSEGTSPELEILRKLGDHAALTPKVMGAIEYRRQRTEPMTLALLQSYIPNEGTAWRQATDELGRFYERVLSRGREQPFPAVPEGGLLHLSNEPIPPAVGEVVGAYTEAAAMLGRRTAELHLALSAPTDDPAFSPEPYTALDQRSRYQSMRNLIGKTLRLLRSRLGTIPTTVQPLAQALVEQEARILKGLAPFLSERLNYQRIRIHGDLHLEQVLFTGRDYVLIDFEGGRVGAPSERRRKRSALRDVAGMVRSFHYAAMSVLRDEAVVRREDRLLAQPWVNVWHAWVSAAYIRGYLGAAGSAPFLVQEPHLVARLLESFILDRAFQELASELTEESDMVEIPLFALAGLLGL
ncbi:MAG: maltose alpha-D-glucosyltransferase [Myxococcota bacterium]